MEAREFILTFTSQKNTKSAAKFFVAARKEEDILDWWKEDRSAYIVTIESIEDLQRVIDHFGKVVILPREVTDPTWIGGSGEISPYYRLEIYDYYRE